jgi:pimeloyl-ACP methyl ester carboxylesterase
MSCPQLRTPLTGRSGWPGSFYEFYGVVERLRAPADAAAPAFHVVLVSMPGFAFSSAPRRTGWDVGDTARVVDTLMGDVLRYPAYMAQGGDWVRIPPPTRRR